MSSSLLPFAGLCLLVACHAKSLPSAAELGAPEPSATPSRAEPPTASKAAPSAVHTLSAGRDAAALAALAARGRERCPDEFLSRKLPSESELAVRIEDVRGDRRTILPLDLALALKGGDDSDVPDGARYAAELLITTYETPRHFRRLNAPRSEWAAGRLQGRLLVWDLSERRVVCQAPLSVRGDASAAPIRRSLRESTRRGLESKLYGRARAEMDVTLAGISAVFRLRPPSAKLAARGS